MSSLTGIKECLTQLPSCMSDNFSYTLQAVQGGFHSRIITPIKNARDNIDVLTKAVQVGLSALALYNWKTGKEALGKLSPSLINAVDMAFFLHLATQFKDFFLPVSATTIDVRKSTEILEDKLGEQFSSCVMRDIQNLAKTLLKDQLDRMYKGNEALPSGTSFGDALTKRIQNHWGITVIDGNGDIKPQNEAKDADLGNIKKTLNLKKLDLSKTEFPIVENSILNRITNAVWFLVDIGTTTMFLKIWNIVDTAKLAHSIGKLKVFGKQPFYGIVKAQPFEVWVRGAIVTGFALNLVKAAMLLYKYSLFSASEQKLRKEKFKLDLAANATDLIYHGFALVNESGFRTIPAGALSVLSIVARSIGIYCALNQPEPKYKALLSVKSAVKVKQN